MTPLALLLLPAWFLAQPVSALQTPYRDQIANGYRYICWKNPTTPEWAGVKLLASQTLGEFSLGTYTLVWWPGDNRYCSFTPYAGPCGSCHAG